MRESYLNEIKSFEGFAAQAKWDYAQFTNGYGTKARFAGEKIDEAEANRRFAAELAEARKFVDQHTAGWDEGTKAALTSLTFNAGTRWASSGLGEAVRSFDVNAVRERFLAYTKAGGVDLPGLVKRRLEEVTWIGDSGDVGQPKIAPAAQSSVAAPVVASEPVDPAEPPPPTSTSTNSPLLSHQTRLDASSADPRAMASLSLILLTLDLAAPSSLAGTRRNDESGVRTEKA
jgi:lysozyme